MNIDTSDDASRIIEETNPTFRLQKLNNVWRRIQDSGICANEHTASYSSYIARHTQQGVDALVDWSQHPPKDAFDPALVQEAHQRMFQGLHPWAGQLRRTEVVFGRFTATSHIHLVMGMAVIHRLVGQLAEQTAFDKMYKMAVFHIAVVGLHPHIDGNGRATRTVLAHQMAQAGFNPVPLFHFIEANKQEYIKANNQGLEANDPKHLANLMANVYSVSRTPTPPIDFRIRYYPASYDPKPLTESNIQYECESQSLPLDTNPDYARDRSCYPNR